MRHVACVTACAGTLSKTRLAPTTLVPDTVLLLRMALVLLQFVNLLTTAQRADVVLACYPVRAGAVHGMQPGVRCAVLCCGTLCSRILEKAPIRLRTSAVMQPAACSHT
jgi:hypothetical protein